MSHRYLDKALGKAGASAKTRNMFRAIYGAATARVEVDDTDGTKILSEAFSIDRGVVQGDIISPLYFILALELILYTHDTQQNKGVQFGGRCIHTLGYADDAALLDTDIDVATARVTAIAQGSRQDADMQISVSKTEVMHVCAQGTTTHTTNAEAQKICKFECQNIG